MKLLFGCRLLVSSSRALSWVVATMGLLILVTSGDRTTEEEVMDITVGGGMEDIDLSRNVQLP